MSSVNHILREHKDLTGEEQIQHCRNIKQYMNKYSYYLLHIPKVQKYILQLWKDKYRSTNYKFSLAKLSKKYNSSIVGHNHRINSRLNRAFSKLDKMIGEKDASELAPYFIRLDLHPMLLLSNEVVSILKATGIRNPFRKQALIYLEKLQKERETLVRCGYKMTFSIIQKIYTSSNYHSSFEDLFQEGLAILYQSTITYDVTQAKTTKWTSYAYSKVKNTLIKHIIDNGKLIRFPRFKFERYMIIDKIKHLHPPYDFKGLAEHANQILSQTQPNLNGSKFTDEEVEFLLQHAIDFNQNLDNVDAIPDKTDIALKSTKPSDFHKLLQKYLDKFDYCVLLKQWNINLPDFDQFEEEQREILTLSSLELKEREMEILNKLFEQNDRGELTELWEFFDEQYNH